MKNPFHAQKKSPLGFYDVQPRELETMRFELRVFDVREADEWSGELGHLSFAEHAPLGSIESILRPMDREAPLLFVCRSGCRSARAASLALSLGFLQVGNLSGGMLAVRSFERGPGQDQ